MSKLIIMQGLPGAGKDYWLRANYPHAKVCSADNFFRKRNPQYDNGGVGFDPSLLGEAHAACFSAALHYMSEEVDARVVAISNTNLQNEAISPYVMLGTINLYQIEIVRIHRDPVLAFKRNTHGVPEFAYPGMMGAFNEWKPWAPWTFDDNITITEVK